MATQTIAYHGLNPDDEGQDTLGAAAWASIDLLPQYPHLVNHWPVDDSWHYPAAIRSDLDAGWPQPGDDAAPRMHVLFNSYQPWDASGRLTLPSPLSTPTNVPTSIISPRAAHNTQLRQNINPCLGCKLHKSTCVGMPLCQRCAENTGFERPPTRLAESPFLFLNYEIWFRACQELGQQLRGPKPVQQTTHLPSQSCCKLILELDFEDLRLRRDVTNTYTVVCDFHPDTQTKRQRRPEALVQTPRPHINTEMFDHFVLTAMWRPSCTQKRPKKASPTVKQEQEAPSEAKQYAVKLSKAEVDLFEKAQLVVGYYSLLRNLDSIWLDETALPAVDGRLVLAELTYLFAKRIGVLIVKVSSMCPSLGGVQFEHHSSPTNVDGTPSIRPSTLLYAVEILYRGIKSSGLPEWNLEQTPRSHPLRRLYAEVSEAYHFMLKNVLAYQCHLSTLHGSRHNDGAPGLVELLRTAKAGLPRHLIVAMQRYVPPEEASTPLPSFKSFPCLHMGQGLHSIVEILAVRSGGVSLAILEGIWTPNRRYPKFWIHENNSTSKYESKDMAREDVSDKGRTDVSIGYPHTATRQGLTLLDQHPDPPGPHSIESSTLALAGLHINDEYGDPNNMCENRSLGTEIVNLVDFIVPEQWRPDFCDSQGQRRPESQNWELRPTGVTVPRRKRRRGDNEDEDLNSESESTRPSKCRERLGALHPDMYRLLAFQPDMERLMCRVHGHEPSSQYLEGVRKSLIDSQK